MFPIKQQENVLKTAHPHHPEQPNKVDWEASLLRAISIYILLSGDLKWCRWDDGSKVGRQVKEDSEQKKTCTEVAMGQTNTGLSPTALRIQKSTVI